MTIQQLIDLLEQVPNKDQAATAQFHTRNDAGQVIDWPRSAAKSF
jgi:hypothetical protein